MISLTRAAIQRRVPLLALAGLALVIRKRDAGRFLRGYVATTSVALLIVAAYLVSIGWLPLRTWTM